MPGCQAEIAPRDRTGRANEAPRGQANVVTHVLAGRCELFVQSKALPKRCPSGRVDSKGKRFDTLASDSCWRRGCFDRVGQDIPLSAETATNSVWLFLVAVPANIEAARLVPIGGLKSACLQATQPLASAGTGAVDQELVADELAAAVGEDG